MADDDDDDDDEDSKPSSLEIGWLLKGSVVVVGSERAEATHRRSVRNPMTERTHKRTGRRRIVILFCEENKTFLGRRFNKESTRSQL